jgi:hypothetical protein
MKRLALFSTILTVALAIIAITALAQSEAAPMAPAQTARVRVVHGIPDAPAVDVYVNGVMAFGGAAFKGVTDYAGPLPTDDYLVQVVVSGTTDLNNYVFSETLTLGDADYTVIAMGTLSEADAYDPHLHVYEDNNAVPMLNKAHVRFIHVSPDAPAVDVAVAGGPTLFSDVAYMGTGGYYPVEAGTYDLEVLVAGTDTVVLTPTVTVAPNNIYTIFAFGLLADKLDAVPALDQGYNRVRAFHGVADVPVPAVDILVNGVPAFEDIAFQDYTEYAVLPAGTYTVAVAPADSTTPLITEMYTLTGGADLTIAAAGTADMGDMYDLELVAFVDDNSPPASGKARVRFIHLDPGAPAVNIVAEGTLILFEGVEYQQSGGYYKDDEGGVDAGTYEITVHQTPDPPGTVGTLVPPSLDDIPFEDGYVYTIFAVRSGAGTAIPPAAVIIPDRALYKLFLPMVTRNYMAQ